MAVNEHAIRFRHGTTDAGAEGFIAECVACGWTSKVTNQQKAILYGRRHRWFVAHGTTPWDENPFNHMVQEKRREMSETQREILAERAWSRR